MAGLAETCSHVDAILHWVKTAIQVHDDATCTSKENKWLDLHKYLELSEIHFTAPKRQKVKSPSTPSTTIQNVTLPLETEMEDFLHMIAKE